jgi:hypothetical protein
MVCKLRNIIIHVYKLLLNVFKTSELVLNREKNFYYITPVLVIW